MSTWDAATIIARLPVVTFGGVAWRAHRARYGATDAGGSLRVSGRYNRGLDTFPPDQVWPALYCGLGRDVCIGEIVRHTEAQTLPYLNDYLLSELVVELSVVLDCRDTDAFDAGSTILLHDFDFEFSHSIAAAAREQAAEGLLVPSATRLGDVLVVFTDKLRPISTLTQRGESVSMRLYVGPRA